MDQLIQEALRDGSVRSIFSIWEILAALGLAFFLSLLIGYVYRATHRGLSYSVSLVHTIILMGTTISILMLIIGSNIARAFALVGALSIIRFRTAIKEPRDVAFIFIAMAAGMASGTGFYLAAVTFTLFICVASYLMYRLDIGAANVSELLLKVHLAENLDPQTTLRPTLLEHLSEYSLISMESIRGGTLLELVYSVSLRKGVREAALLDAIRAANGNQKVVLLAGQENVNV